MGVPVEIRHVARPRNMVVVDTGSNGPNRYAVRERGKNTANHARVPSPQWAHHRPHHQPDIPSAC